MSNRTVINGLEGCGKSSNLFQKLQQSATPDKPIVFAFKNYRLMREQIESWSSRFNEPKSSFAICGFNKDYEEAIESYTSKDTPWLVPKEVKFILVTQALLQRNKIKSFSFERKLLNLGRPIIQHIVVDEFDFSMGIVPSLDYIVNHCPSGELKEAISKNICDFIFKNYTQEDVYNFQNNTDDKFKLAHWLNDAECDVTFLTSEILATIFLQIIGFEVKDYGKKTFIDECKVFVAKDKNIGRNFFSKMNLNLAWNKLGFDTIISDCIASGYKDTNSLSIDVVTHTSARGSNSYIGKDILTIISYIPKSKIEEIKDCINCFVTLRNRDGFKYPYFKYNEVEALFYRDRMCQAVGRVIGYRGSKETHMLIHENLWHHMDSMGAFDLILSEVISNRIDMNKFDELQKSLGIYFNELIMSRLMNGIAFIPFTKEHWYFEFEGKNDIWEKIDEANERSKKTGFDKKKNTINNKRASTASNLNLYFELNEANEMNYKEIQEIIIKNKISSIAGKGLLQPAKVAKHFGLTIKKSNGQYIIIGIKGK